MKYDITTLGEYAKVQGGYAYKSSDFQEDGKCPVLKIKNVRFGYVDYQETAFIHESLAESTSNWKTKEGDILISMTGSGPNAPNSLVGRAARVWKNDPDAWINQRVGRLTMKQKESIHPDILFYLLSLSSSQEYLVSNSSGSANQANINGKTIESLPCPKIDYQSSIFISKVLREFDEKIAINQQINQTLEAMAQAVFKSWFVDFEPTRAKITALKAGGTEQDATLAAMTTISGKSPAELATLKTTNPEAYANLQTTATLFPSRLVESELGEIPEGWEAGRIGDVAKIAFR
ncbi:MAG: restriction endonuclease subunit S [Rickettsiales bacterium]|nr:restriction endonuclease subunit S [Rickettsiales bacterium]